MENIIFFFTGTGSSLATAKRIANNLGECDIHSISNYNPHKFNSRKHKKIGFIFPNYYGTMPQPMKRFIEKLDLSDNPYCFAVSCTGGIVAMTLADLANTLNQKGVTLNYSAYTTNGSNYIVAPYYTLLSYKGETLKKNVNKNNQLLDKISIDISKCKENKPPKIKVGTLFPKLLYGKKLKDNRINISKDFSTLDSCNSCGICKKICPADNIKIKNNEKPQWQEKCEDCCACIQACPKKAILLKGKVINKVRYFHPDTSISEVISYNTKKY